MALSIILPAKNEAKGLGSTLPKLKDLYPNAEILVVNDGSSDATLEICDQYGVKVISHPYSMGNGAAIKTGARNASGDLLAFMDADGQHDPEALRALLSELDKGFEMVVGARLPHTHASRFRLVANSFYNRFASWVSGHNIQDLTSGFRVAKAERFREFLYILPNGFSYPTSITMAFLRSGYPVAYVPIEAEQRIGKSHIRPLHDGVRFLLIIFRIGTLYSPLKIFLPFSAFFFAVGTGYYLFTYITQGRFTNMSALLLITSILIFLIGLVSEQITTLLYRE
jgi:glycosyltransferase involved in cell wall biosynthesis